MHIGRAGGGGGDGGGCGGFGAGPLRDTLPRFEEPFKNAYGGKLYFMIDGNGNSTTGHFMSLVKAHDLGLIIGEELGSNQFCTGGSLTCRLTNTQLDFYVANGTHITTATGLPDETGILPDHTIPHTIDAYLKRVDPVKDFTLGLIETVRITVSVG